MKTPVCVTILRKIYILKLGDQFFLPKGLWGNGTIEASTGNYLDSKYVQRQAVNVHFLALSWVLSKSGQNQEWHRQIPWLSLPEKSCVDRSSDGLSEHAQSAKAEGAMYGSSADNLNKAKGPHLSDGRLCIRATRSLVGVTWWGLARPPRRLWKPSSIGSFKKEWALPHLDFSSN